MEQGGARRGRGRGVETLAEASGREVNKLLERTKKRGKGAGTSSASAAAESNSGDETKAKEFFASACGAPAAVGEANEAKEDDDIDWEIDNVDDSQAAEPWNGEVTIELGGTPPSSRGAKRGRRATAKDKDFAELVHKTHLLCLLARGRLVDAACNDPLLKASLSSLLPPHLLPYAAPEKINVSRLKLLVKWFSGVFRVGDDGSQGELQDRLPMVLAKQTGSEEEVAAVSVGFFRGLGFDTRFVSVLDVTPIKPDAESLEASKDWSSKIRQESNARDREAFIHSAYPACPPVADLLVNEAADPASQPAARLPIYEALGTASETATPEKCSKERGARAKGVSAEKSSGRALAKAPGNTAEDSKKSLGSEEHGEQIQKKRKRKCDEEFELELARAIEATTSGSPASSTSRPVGKNNAPSPSSQKVGKKTCAPSHWSRKKGPLMHWAEVYCGDAATGSWIHVDAARQIVGDPGTVEAAAGRRPIRYVCAWSKIAGSRVNKTWWDRCILPLKDLETNSYSRETAFKRERCAREEMELETKTFTEPLPTNQQAYRGHHLYAIERWLTKYQTIYPKGPVLGTCGGWPVYPRSCVQDLHTKERWLREGFAVKAGEAPVKVVKARHKEKSELDPSAEKQEEALLVNLYGKWQTEPWQPPPAVNGIVPRNERGQIDIWSEKCIPPGTVHLRLPRLGPIAQMLKVDFAPAMVGFEIRQGRSVPVYEGIVVCEEFKDAILEVYRAEEERRQSEVRRKKEAQACVRWRQLLRSISTRQRLRAAYEVQEDAAEGNAKEHVHSFLEKDEDFDEASGIRTKRCRCGFELQVEEM